MKIIRMKLEGGTKFPKQYRYNETSGEVEVTYDDGATWTPDPTADPRTSTALIQVKGAGSECDAATNITAFLQTNIENVLGAMADFGTAGGIVGALTSLLLTAFFALGPFGIIVTLFFALSAYLAELGSAAIQTAFAADEWDTVKCQIYCRVPYEGKFSEADMSDIRAAMSAHLNPTAAGIVNAFLLLMGPVGTTNAAHTGAGGSDCGDCDCGTCADFTQYFGTGITGYTIWYGSLVGSFIQSAVYGNISWGGVGVTVPPDCKVVSVTVNMNISRTNGGTTIEWQRRNAGGTVLQSVYESPTSPTSGTYSRTYTFNADGASSVWFRYGWDRRYFGTGTISIASVQVDYE